MLGHSKKKSLRVILHRIEYSNIFTVKLFSLVNKVELLHATQISFYNMLLILSTYFDLTLFLWAYFFTTFCGGGGASDAHSLTLTLIELELFKRQFWKALIK